MKTEVKFLETSGTLAELKDTGILEITETSLIFTADSSDQSHRKLSRNSLQAVSGTNTVLCLIFKNLEAECVLELPSLEIKAAFRKALESELSVQEETPDAAIRKCPFCAEEIKPEAIKCRFCGESLPQDTLLATEETIDTFLWYVQDGSKRIGPLKKDEVEALFRQNAIDTESLVWRRGQSDWLPLRQISELSNLADMPPPSYRKLNLQSLAVVTGFCANLGTGLELCCNRTREMGYRKKNRQRTSTSGSRVFLRDALAKRRSIHH